MIDKDTFDSFPESKKIGIIQRLVGEIADSEQYIKELFESKPIVKAENPEHLEALNQTISTILVELAEKSLNLNVYKMFYDLNNEIDSDIYQEFKLDVWRSCNEYFHDSYEGGEVLYMNDRCINRYLKNHFTSKHKVQNKFYESLADEEKLVAATAHFYFNSLPKEEQKILDLAEIIKKKIK